MIKELVLSLALAAASGVPFLDSPKKAISNVHEAYGSYYFGFNYNSNNDEVTATFQTPLGNLTEYQQSLEVYYQVFITSQNQNLKVNYTLYDDNTASVSLYWYFDTAAKATNFYNSSIDNFSLGSDSAANVEETNLDTSDNYAQIAFDVPQWQTDLEISFTLVDPNPIVDYTLATSFTNCSGYVVGSGGQLIPLPSVYNSETVQNPYTCRFYAADGYYFDNRLVSANISQSGGIGISNVVFDTALNNPYYVTGFSCSITLPLANCTLSAVANSYNFTITSELNRCSVSGLPAGYTNQISGTYVFIAAANNGFNRNAVSYEITGATYEVSYSGVLYGDFYQNLTISIEAYFSDVSIRVTAVSYDPEPYQQGYQDGYDAGYAQGKIAGDSYGVWNWLKQAARTTGEFLNIPLLPGFSIGGLLTAIAGLVIIWLFVKGFLFKS